MSEGKGNDEDVAAASDEAASVAARAVDAVARPVRAVRREAERTAGRVEEVGGAVKAQASDLTEAARRDDRGHWLALFACAMASVATAIDPPILQATSSAVQGALRVDPPAAVELVGLYYLVQAATMVIGGVLGDMIGMRRVLLVALWGMLGMSLLVALAPSLTFLVPAHVGLTLFGAVAYPLSLGAVMRTFGQRLMPIALGIYLSAHLIGALASPPLAQFLYNVAGFPATMVPAVLATLVAAIGVRRWVPVLEPGERLSLYDAVSLALWSVGMFGLVYATVAFAGGWGSLRGIIGLLGIILLVAAAFRLARGSTRLRLPRLPFRMLGLALFLGAVLAFAQSGPLLQLSNFLKGVQAYSPIASGIAILPYALAVFVVAMATGYALTRRYGVGQIELKVFRRPITVGMLGLGVSVMMLGLLEPDTDYLFIGVALTLLGAGASLANVPRTILLFQSVRMDRVGIAAGLNGSCFTLGQALGNFSLTAMIAVVGGATWQQQMVDAGMTTDQAVQAYETALQQIFLATVHPWLEPSMLDVASQIPGWTETFTAGFTASMLVVGAIALVSAAVAFVGLRGRSRAEEASLDEGLAAPAA
jgi:MFS transporter, DHA2 family, multidrug resistance protein